MRLVSKVLLALCVLAGIQGCKHTQGDYTPHDGEPMVSDGPQWTNPGDVERAKAAFGNFQM